METNNSNIENKEIVIIAKNEKIAKQILTAKATKKIAEQKTDKANLDFSILKKSKSTRSHHYDKILKNLQTKEGKEFFSAILSEEQIKHILSDKDNFLKSGTDRYSDFYTEKKKIRVFWQDLNKLLKNTKDSAILQKGNAILKSFDKYTN